MTTVNFYHDLPALESFAEAIEPARQAQVPGDWWVFIADVIGSTKAIEGGGYKKVNTVGVACIAAVVNVDRSVEVPFVFGGDGARFAVPDSLHEGSFEGFACRWQGVPSFHDHKLALLVAAVSGDADANLASYRGVSDKIAQIYGDVSSYRPLGTEHMWLSFSPRQLGHE